MSEDIMYEFYDDDNAYNHWRPSQANDKPGGFERFPKSEFLEPFLQAGLWYRKVPKDPLLRAIAEEQNPERLNIPSLAGRALYSKGSNPYPKGS